MAEDNGELRLQLSTILSELTSLKREVHGTNQNVATEVKKLKTEKDLRWKFQGNKSQYDFNCDIVDTLKQAEWAIENYKLEHCSDQLKEALDKLHTRNKIHSFLDIRKSIDGSGHIKIHSKLHLKPLQFTGH